MNVRTWFRAALVGAATFAITAGAAIAQSEMTDKIRLESAAPAAQYDFAVTGGNLSVTKVGGGGNVGLGTTAPTATLEVSANGTTKILSNDTSGSVAERSLFELSNMGKVRFRLNNRNTGVTWTFDNAATGFEISDIGDGVSEFSLSQAGNLTILGTLTQNSDVNRKLDLEPIASQEILDKVAGLEILKWSYREAPNTRHVGPTAQGFHAAFGLGDTDKGIAAVDADGVSLAAIQALYHIVQEQQREIADLKARLEGISPAEQ